MYNTTEREVMGMANCRNCIHSGFCYLTIRDEGTPCEFVDKRNLVEVVRCKDCKNYRPPFCLLNDNKHGWLNHVLPDHFCSYGERGNDG